MTEEGTPFRIAGRLGAISAMLLALTTSSPSGSVFALHALTVTSSWGASDASVTTMDEESRRLRAAEVALAEVGTTRSVFEIQDLANTPGFFEFIEQVRAALDTYESSHREPQHTMTLATSLAIARAVLHGQVATLPQWSAMARTPSSLGDRYVKIPEKFVSQVAFSIIRETPPNAADAAAMFEFDHVAEA